MSNIKPGIYENIPFETYKTWEAVNQSTLKEILRSPMHYRYLCENPKKQTPAMKLGNALEIIAFEKEDFGNQFHVHRKFDGRKTLDKEEKAILLDKWGEDRLLSEDEYIICQVLDRKLESNEGIKKILSQERKNQLSLCWNDGETGILCKARLDAWLPGLKTIIDLKTTYDAEPNRYVRNMLNIGGHFQSAFYFNALLQLNVKVEHFIHIVFETKPPHDLVSYEIPNEILNYGDKKVTYALKALKECQENNSWPGYSGALPVPGWLNSNAAEDFIQPTMEEF